MRCSRRPNQRAKANVGFAHGPTISTPSFASSPGRAAIVAGPVSPFAGAYSNGMTASYRISRRIASVSSSTKASTVFPKAKNVTSARGDSPAAEKAIALSPALSVTPAAASARSSRSPRAEKRVQLPPSSSAYSPLARTNGTATGVPFTETTACSSVTDSCPQAVTSEISTAARPPFGMPFR